MVAGATALLPWWAGVLLAMISYLALHSVAERPSATSLQPGQLGIFAVSALWQTLAMVGQYLLPFLFLLGAGMSASKRRKSAQLYADASNRSDAVAQMTWLEFESLVGEFFRKQGYLVVAQGGAGPDGGVDVLLKKGSDRYLVQCKHWRALRVGVQPVRELYGVMAAQRVAGGFLVTSGSFTEEADRFAAGREIKLIDGQAESVKPVVPATISCPLCQSTMVLRQTRQGATPSRQFWGCGSYAKTKCRGTRELLP